jgi:hypothetical protein
MNRVHELVSRQAYKFSILKLSIIVCMSGLENTGELWPSSGAAIHIETGRYEGLPVGETFCFCCNDNHIVEDELHVLLHCPMYKDLRVLLVHEAAYVCPNFYSLIDDNKLCFILSNIDIVKYSVKTC